MMFSQNMYDTMNNSSNIFCNICIYMQNTYYLVDLILLLLHIVHKTCFWVEILFCLECQTDYCNQPANMCVTVAQLNQGKICFIYRFLL